MKTKLNPKRIAYMQDKTRHNESEKNRKEMNRLFASLCGFNQAEEFFGNEVITSIDVAFFKQIANEYNN